MLHPPPPAPAPAPPAHPASSATSAPVFGDTDAATKEARRYLVNNPKAPPVFGATGVDALNLRRRGGHGPVRFGSVQPTFEPFGTEPN